MWLALALACTAPSNSPRERPQTSQAPTTPTSPTTPTTPDLASWTVAVWMDGDNDLEPLVLRDLDELEAGVAPGVNIVVQADRIPGYDDRDGDWTGTRRYAMVADSAPGLVTPMAEDLGEVDMADPDALAEFLLWADAQAPAEHLALVMWNHGGGFWIASDDTSGSIIELDKGELDAAIAPLNAARGRPLDLIAFDACNMGQWETAHSLVGDVDVFVASEAWVDYGGYAYDTALPELAALGSAADAAAMGEALARSAVEANGEGTHAAIDLAAVGVLSFEIDALAAAWLADPSLLPDFVRARSQSQGVDPEWDEFWLDLGELADAAAASPDPGVADAGVRVRDALDQAVIGNWAAAPLAWTSGLTVFTETSTPSWVDRYSRGPWADDTQWDELIEEVARAGH